jgi:hypothetical protein
LQERPQENFRVALRQKLVAQYLQFLTQFEVIVDFAVEDKDRPSIVAEQWLGSSRQIDDLQPHGA